MLVVVLQRCDDKCRLSFHLQWVVEVRKYVHVYISESYAGHAFSSVAPI